jgi:hypothetical protein
MDRRSFLELSAGGSLAMSSSTLAQAADAKPQYIELLKIRMRNTQDSMVQRTTEFFGKVWLPAAQRAGVTASGAFNALIGEDSPFLLFVLQFPTLTVWESLREKMAADKDYLKARDTYGSGPLGYVRYETSLLRGFSSFPGIEVPAAAAGGKSRIFEIRTYESNNSITLGKKIGMFDNGEIAIFRKVGMVPVFFGETVIGQNQPNLTYMIGYDDLAARDKVWSAFGASPEWQKLRAQPGLSDGEIVSNISNSMVRPTAFSAIR